MVESVKVGGIGGIGRKKMTKNAQKVTKIYKKVHENDQNVRENDQNVLENDQNVLVLSTFLHPLGQRRKTEDRKRKTNSGAKERKK